MQGSKDFFFEKKKQKTFDDWAGAYPAAYANVQKFFGSFFVTAQVVVVGQSA
jgi:hypothetical protein